MIGRLTERIRNWFSFDCDHFDDDSRDGYDSGTLMDYIRPGEKLENPYAESSKNNDKSGLGTRIEC